MRRCVSVTLVFLSVSSSVPGATAVVSAQEPGGSVTLEEALDLFAQNSPGLQLARSRLRGSLGGIRQVRALPNPRLAVTHEALGDYSESYLNLSQELDFLWEGANRGVRAEALRSRAEAQFSVDSASLVLEVKRAYLDAWGYREALSGYRLADSVVAGLLTSAEARFAEGDLAGYDLRRLRLERVQSAHRTATGCNKTGCDR